MNTMLPFGPEGYVSGCHPRASAFGTVCKTFADEFRVFTDEECRDLLAQGQGTVMLPSIPITFDQGSNGSCAWESTTAGVQLSRAVAGCEFDQLNPLSGYYYTKGSRRSKDGGGSSIDENLIHARNVGILPESLWPRSKGHMQAPPAELIRDEAPKNRIAEFYDIDDRWQTEIRTALLSPFPVIVGLEGHSVYGCGMYDMNTSIYHNSWNGHAAPWNPWVCPELPKLKGLGLIPLSRINPAYGIFAIRTVTDAGGKP